MNTESAFHPDVLWNSDLSSCYILSILFGCEVSRISFKHTFLWRKLLLSSSAPTTEPQHMLKLIFRLQCSFHTKRRCGTNYKARPMCSNMFNHILLMRPSLIVQHFLQKYWFAVLALNASVSGAAAIMKRLHRKTLEIPSASSRTLISNQRYTARERTCSLWLYLGKDFQLLISHWALWGTPGWSCWTRKAKTRSWERCLAGPQQMLALRNWSCLERHCEKMEIS